MSSQLDHLDESHFVELSKLEPWYWWHQVRFRWVWKHLHALGVDSLADVGCGTGGFLQFLSQRGVRRIHGFEGSPTAMRILDAMSIPYTTWSWGETAVKEHPGLYDAVALLDVLEHMDDDLGLLVLTSSLLVPGGVFAITVPADPRLMSDWDRILHHRRRYTRASLLQLCQHANLEVLQLSSAFRWAWLLGIWRAKSKIIGNSFPQTGRLLNRLILWLSEIEINTLGRFPMGSGTSYFLIARKRGDS